MSGNVWQIRCLTCDTARNAEDVGIIRKGAYGRKYTLGWCSRCRWLRRCVIEQVPERGFEVIVNGGGTGESGASGNG